jgi:hypothetical protein
MSARAGAGAGRWPDELLESLREQGDPTVDPIVRDLFRRKEVEAVNAAMRAMTDNAATPDAMPPAVAAWLREHRALPAWADRARMDRASRFFVDHGVSISMLLGLSSLLEAYAAKKGVKVLYATDQMGATNADRRLGETTQFLLTVMAPGALFAGGNAIPTILKVRFMHGAVRRLLLDAGWDVPGLGLPICQEDLLGTLMTFSYAPLLHLPKLGVVVPPDLADDFVHHWNVIGTLLGIPREIMPASFDEARQIAEAIAARHQGPSHEGIELTRALLDVYARRVPGTALDGVILAIARWLAGDAVADWLEVPRSRWQFVLGARGFFAKVWNGAQNRSTVVNDVVNRIGLRLLRAGTSSFLGGAPAEFKMSAELRDAWRMPPPGVAGKVRSALPGLVDALLARAPGREAAARRLVVDLAVMVASADADIDDFEVLAISAAMLDAALPPDEARARVEACASAIAERGFDAHLRDVAAGLAWLDAVDEGLRIAIAMAYASTGISRDERAVLDAVAREANVSPADLAARIDATRAAIDA